MLELSRTASLDIICHQIDVFYGKEFLERDRK